MLALLDPLRQLLAASPLALLFLTIGLGYLISHLRLAGVPVGIAAVLFAGLLLGVWGEGAFVLPEFVLQLGLLLFVYMIGLQSGPAFFRLLRRRGLALGGLALLAVAVAGALTWGLAGAAGLSPALAAGLFCGATTNTPALAAASEALRGTTLALVPTVGYSIAYPLGVAVPLLVAELALRLARADMPAEARLAEAELGPPTEEPGASNLRVENPALAGRLLGELPFDEMAVRVSRVQHGEDVKVATPDARLALGDVVHVVGGPHALARAALLVGRPIEGAPGPEASRDQVDFRRIFVSSPAVVGQRLGDLALATRFGAVATRLRRGDRDFVPTDDTVVERGDRLRVVARPAALPGVAAYLGDSVRALGETDFLSLSLGLVAGMALGAVHVPLPGGFGFSLGLAGGALLVSLVLGALGRSGPIDWHIPSTANAAFRQLGLVLFFAAAGLGAGSHFVAAAAAQGLVLLAIGAAVTLASAVVLLFGARHLLGADWVTASGVLAGGQTQPALLAYAGERAGSEAPNDAYVAVMPAAMIAKILVAQLLLTALGVS